MKACVLLLLWWDDLVVDGPSRLWCIWELDLSILHILSTLMVNKTITPDLAGARPPLDGHLLGQEIRPNALLLVPRTSLRYQCGGLSTCSFSCLSIPGNWAQQKCIWIMSNQRSHKTEVMPKANPFSWLTRQPVPRYRENSGLVWRDRLAIKRSNWTARCAEWGV